MQRTHHHGFPRALLLLMDPQPPAKKGDEMPRYITLINWTEQGVKNYRDTVDRADSAKKVAADMGGSIDIHWTLGEYDIVVMSDFPDDETATAYLLKLGSLGNVRTKTMRAFDSADVERIIAKS